MALGAHESAGPSVELAARGRMSFAVVVPGVDVPEGFASALRLEFGARRMRGMVRSLRARVGSYDLARPEAELWRTLEYAQLTTVVDRTTPLDLERTGPGRAVLEVPFEQPLAVEGGGNLLLHVEIDLAAGARLAAYPDLFDRAQFEHAVDDPLMPAAYLLVAGGPPQARSLWYDSGAERPRWQRADTWPVHMPGVDFEFQSTGLGPDGHPDARIAGPWRPDLRDVAPRRFVRFRVRFEDPPELEGAARIDRIVMPYER